MTPSHTPSQNNPRTALFLSSGAMFGAYHAGAWKALARRFRPDVVVGASIGSLNGWMIAGGVDPDALAERWRSAEFAGSLRLRYPKMILDGFLRAEFLEQAARELVAHFTPQCEFALVATRVWPPRPELFHGREISWQHLASSCAVPLMFPHYKLNGALYTDGGLMQALPFWPARELGCTRVVAVNCLPKIPIPGSRTTSKALRAVSRRSYGLAPGIEILTVSPTEPMGGLRDFLVWKRSNVERWIELGYADAMAAMESRPEWFQESSNVQAFETASS